MPWKKWPFAATEDAGAGEAGANRTVSKSKRNWLKVGPHQAADEHHVPAAFLAGEPAPMRPSAPTAIQ